MELPEAVALAQEQNQDGFTQLVQDYHSFVLSLVAYYVGYRDAHDVAQDIWLVVHQKLWQLSDGGKFLPWLRKLVFYHCLNFRKARARRQDKEIHLAPDSWIGLMECVASEDATPEVLLERDDLCRLVSRELDNLPGDYGLILRLYYLGELSYDEIIELTGLPLSTVKWRMYHGRKLLKARLAEVFRT